MLIACERQQDALDLLNAVPTTWNEMLGLDGRIGQWALLASRKGSEWWIAAMADWDKRPVAVPLAFLGDGTWEATVLANGPNAEGVGTDYRRATRDASAKGSLRLDLAGGGGAVIRLCRK